MTGYKNRSLNSCGKKNKFGKRGRKCLIFKSTYDTSDLHTDTIRTGFHLRVRSFSGQNYRCHVRKRKEK